MDNEIEVVAKALPSTTEVQTRIDDMLANRKHMIERVKPMLIDEVDIYTLPGMKKPSLGKPGAEKLAAIFGLRASFTIDKDTMDVIGKTADGKSYVAYICTLTNKGEFAGEGRGATFMEWKRNSYRKVYKKDFATLTEEEKKAAGAPIKAMGKFGEYEMYKVPEAPVFDGLALNKAIKMAQKSAFVDAVIRTTGMSDLFTQDVEDMDMSMYADEPAHAPTPEVAPAPVVPAAKITDEQVIQIDRLIGELDTPADEVYGWIKTRFNSDVKDLKESEAKAIINLLGQRLEKKNGEMSQEDAARELGAKI